MRSHTPHTLNIIMGYYNALPSPTLYIFYILVVTFHYRRYSSSPTFLVKIDYDTICNTAMEVQATLGPYSKSTLIVQLKPY